MTNRIGGFGDEDIKNTMGRLMEIGTELSAMMEAGTSVELKIIERPAIVVPNAQVKTHTIIITKPRVLLLLQSKE